MKTLITISFVLDIVLKVRQPLETEIAQFKEHGNLISFLYPALNKPLIEKMAQRKMTAFGNLAKH